MVAIGFLAQGAAYGMTYGMAGTFIGPATEEFGASRARSLGPSLVALLHGLLGPIVGWWLARRSVRPSCRALMMAAAFAVMYIARGIWTFSLAYGLLGGVAVSCLGMFRHGARDTLVSSVTDRSASFMPILVMLLPPVAGYINVHQGWRTTALLAAFATLAMLPLFALVREPRARRQLHLRTPSLDGHEVDRFRNRSLSTRCGVLAARRRGRHLRRLGVTMIAHVIPYATTSDRLPASDAAHLRHGALRSPARRCGDTRRSHRRCRSRSPWCGIAGDRLGSLPPDPPLAVLAGAMALLGFCRWRFAGLMAQRSRGGFAARHWDPPSVRRCSHTRSISRCRCWLPTM
jgi:hypothetical protein